MAMVATKAIAKFFETSSTRQFLLLAQNDKKGYKNLIFTFLLKSRCFFSLFGLLNLSVETALPHKIPYFFKYTLKSHSFIVNQNSSFFNPFSANIPIIEKPGSWSLLAKCVKNACGRVTF